MDSGVSRRPSTIIEPHAARAAAGMPIGCAGRGRPGDCPARSRKRVTACKTADFFGRSCSWRDPHPCPFDFEARWLLVARVAPRQSTLKNAIAGAALPPQREHCGPCALALRDPGGQTAEGGLFAYRRHALRPVPILQRSRRVGSVIEIAETRTEKEELCPSRARGRGRLDPDGHHAGPWHARQLHWRCAPAPAARAGP